MSLCFRDSQIFDRIRGQDIKLLKEFNVRHICDLMLENKKVKYFLKYVLVSWSGFIKSETHNSSCFFSNSGGLALVIDSRTNNSC